VNNYNRNIIGQETKNMINSKLNEHGIVLIQDKGIKDLILSDALSYCPPSWNETINNKISDFLLSLIGSELGQPFTWNSNQNGRLITNIMPSKGKEIENGKSSACRVELSLHTEDAFHPLTCKYLILLCVHNPNNIKTMISNINNINLDKKTWKILEQDRYLILPDIHNIEINEYKKYAQPLSLIYYNNNNEKSIRIDFDFTQPFNNQDEEALNALNDLKKQLIYHVNDVPLQSGDIIILNNEKVVHGRREFNKVSYDSNRQERHLKRILVRSFSCQMFDINPNRYCLADSEYFIKSLFNQKNKSYPKINFHFITILFIFCCSIIFFIFSA